MSVSTNNYYVTYETPPFAPDNGGALANNLITVLGEAADVNGNVFAQVAPSSVQTVTPAAPGASTQVGLGVTQAKLRIMRDGISDITWQKVNVIAGEKIAMASQFSTNIATISSYFWLGMHGAISNYSISSDQNTGQVFWLTNYADFTNSTISYHYHTPGTKAVLLTVEVAGKTMRAETSFNVASPTYELTICPSNTVGFDTNFSNGTNGVVLHFGDAVSRAGMNFRAVPISLVETNFSLDFLQLISFEIRYWHTNGSRRYVGAQAVLDAFPYPADMTNNVLASEDNPNVSPAASWTGLSRSDSFELDLMYRSGRSGSIYVPIAKSLWFWNGVGTNLGNWTLVFSNFGPMNCITTTAAGGFPTWTNTFERAKTNWVSF